MKDGKLKDSGKEEGKTFHKLHVLGVNDYSWDRLCGLGSETRKGCESAELPSGGPDAPQWNLNNIPDLLKNDLCNCTAIEKIMASSPCAAKSGPTISDPPAQCAPFLPVKGLVDELSDVTCYSFLMHFNYISCIV